ncbi:DUF1772 domain-containing protein [Nocardia nova]|uniref:DUF1772 domain-containing protein n=1 Tax=Nocardia nova TaxID=37330 RepID=A0A2S6AJA1_9NOCA|nr:anthrone oxygenase family protein [Nocardia nova]PPJ24443.1 DUF1772 domain-containing protein [Nocardia nova]PPJ35291.1 DUF1772 domain-containing protein [Nocardia nova]
MTATTATATSTTSGFATGSLIGATVTTGLLAGVFYAYASSVMLALRQLDDRTFVDVMNRINTVIVNPVFMLSFLGSVAFTGLAAVLYWRTDQRTVLWWVLLALALNVISFLITSGGNVPLNNQLADTSSGDFAALRHQFESPWITLNILRALANTGALGVLAWALRTTNKG